MEQRRVMAGHLGCPVCGWSTAWTDGVPDFGDAWLGDDAPPFDAPAAYAMLGLDGPGGWIALAGNAAALAQPLAELLPGVAFVALNPPAGVAATNTLSAVRSGNWPLKTHSMRGVVLGGDASIWRDAAIQATLPGLRTIGCGEPPTRESVQLLADAGGVWVATHR